MANWKYTLDVKAAWEKVEKDELAPQEFAGIARDKLKPIAEKEPQDAMLKRLISALDAFSNDLNADTDEFDRLWNDVYNWADTQTAQTWPPSRLCWVKTF